MAEAWVTLATNDAYALGALVLAQSLKRVMTTRKTHCIITNGVSQGMREHLHSHFDNVSCVDVLDSKDEENLALIERPDLGCTFTKLHCWRLTQYDKCVFLDADTMFLKNADELFAERDEFSAAPDIGWPDMFNSGVFVFRPSVETYRALMQCALTHGSFDGGDQGLLNTYYNGWRDWDSRYRLPFIYNMSSSAVYSYAAAYKQFGPQVKIVHFLGAVKPWHYAYNESQGTVHSPSGHVVGGGGKSSYSHSHLLLWWHLFTHDLQPHLQPQYHPPLATSPHVMARRAPPAAARPCLKHDGHPPTARVVQHPHIQFDSVAEELSPVGASPDRTDLTDTTNSQLLISEKENQKPPISQELKEFIEKEKTPLPTRYVARGPVDGPSIQKVYRIHIKKTTNEPATPSAVKYGLQGIKEASFTTKGLKPSRSGQVKPLILRVPTNISSTVSEEPPPPPASAYYKQRKQRAGRPRGAGAAVPEWAEKVSSHAAARASTSAQMGMGGAGKDDDTCVEEDEQKQKDDDTARDDTSEPEPSCSRPTELDYGRRETSLTGGYVGPVASAGTPNLYEHQRAWEAGRIDYTGRDSWENIQRRLDASLIKAPDGKTSSVGPPPKNGHPE